jgi:hypothetical protein
MKLSLKRLVAIGVVGAGAALAPAANASAAPVPVALPHLPAFALPAAGWAAAPLGFRGPQVAIGPTVIGSVFNGGTSVVVSNDPPVNSGNVIGSP